MKITQISAKTLPDLWYQVLWNLYEKVHGNDGARRYNVQTGSFPGVDRIEFDLAVLRVEMPWVRPLLPTIPENLPIPPPCDEKYLNDYMLYLLSPDVQPNEHYTYGNRLMVGFQKCIDYYKKHGTDTNRMCLEIGKPEDIDLYDLDSGDGSSPCLRLVDTRVLDGKLNFICYFRSWNAYSGLPMNLAGLQQVKELMAGEIGVEDGELIAISKGLNIREHELEVVSARLYKDYDKNIGKGIYNGK